MLRFYLNCRENVSFLLANGHVSARMYPLAYLWNEVRIVQRRRTALVRENAIIMQGVVASWADGGKYLQGILERLGDGE